MPTKYKVSYIEGDGIGPEIFAVARSALDALQELYHLNLELIPAPAGDGVLKAEGKALPPDTVEEIKNSHACLKGPVGETAADTIIKLRRELDLFSNIRPARNHPFIESRFSGVDLVIVRENTEGLYVGKEIEEDGGSRVTSFRVITEKASKRIAKCAFDLALSRLAQRKESPRTSQTKKRESSVVCVQKSNVLSKGDGLFLRSAARVAKKYPKVKFSPMYVDTAAMNLVRAPEDFDVILTENMYGDILSDEASQVVGGLGVAPSANLGQRFGLFEPVHGCAPDIAGRGIANPLAMLFTTEMMLEWLGSTNKDESCEAAAKALEYSISLASSGGARTPDVGGQSTTQEVGGAVCDALRSFTVGDYDEGKSEKLEQKVPVFRQ